jgi:DNA-binding MarR family transcriptional regulator
MEKKLLEQAKFIFSTSKLIRDHIFLVPTHQAINNLQKDNLCELSVTQIHTAMAINQHGPLTLSNLAEMMNVSAPSASAMTDRLVEKGVLKRERSDKDRRKVLISVSPDARKILQNVEDTILNSFIDLVGRLGEETTDKWCEVLTKIRENLEDR